MSTAASSELGAGRLPSFVRDLPLAQAAVREASRLHGGQHRESDQAAFVVHPLEVGSLLYNAGASDEVIAAGILHDTVEKTPATRSQLRDRYGERVAGLVDALTEDEEIEDYEPRKRALREQVGRAGEDAARIYAADKVTKVRELRGRLSRPPALSEEDRGRLAGRLDHYVASLDMLEREHAHDPLVRQLRFELEMLEALPPRA